MIREDTCEARDASDIARVSVFVISKGINKFWLLINYHSGVCELIVPHPTPFLCELLARIFDDRRTGPWKPDTTDFRTISDDEAAPSRSFNDPSPLANAFKDDGKSGDYKSITQINLIVAIVCAYERRVRLLKVKAFRCST